MRMCGGLYLVDMLSVSRFYPVSGAIGGKVNGIICLKFVLFDLCCTKMTLTLTSMARLCVNFAPCMALRVN